MRGQTKVTTTRLEAYLQKSFRHVADNCAQRVREFPATRSLYDSCFGCNQHGLTPLGLLTIKFASGLLSREASG